MKETVKKIFFAILAISVLLIIGCTITNLDSNTQQSENSLSTTANFSYNYSDNRPASKNPPNKLKPEQCPQFVVLGFDDNQYADGMTWVLNMLRTKKNPAGWGNKKIYDGTNVHVSFYLTSTDGIDDQGKPIEVGTDVINTWKQAYADGHDIGNHTYTHDHGAAFTTAQWETEMQKSTDFIVSKVGVPRDSIIGFRVPFLEYERKAYDTDSPSTAYQAMKNKGFTYDCSVEAAWDWDMKDATQCFWPYTLDKGTPGEDPNLGAIAGLWEIPAYCVFSDPANSFGLPRTTGLDWNLFYGVKANKAQALAALKYTLNNHSSGNRCPMTFGLHSNEYSSLIEPAPNASLTDRRATIEEFVNYALTKPEVRVISTAELLTWLRNPANLGPETAPTPSVTPTPPIAPEWSYPVNYAVGDKVIYNDKLFVCKVAHSSNSAWTPIGGGASLWEEIAMPSPSGTQIATPTYTATATKTATPINTPTRTPTYTATTIPPPTSTYTATKPTVPATSTYTATKTNTPVKTATFTATKTPTPSSSNIAKGKTATASSVEGTGYEASKAVDGSSTTRWSSVEGVDPQWIYVDLGSVYSVSKVILKWEAAYAKAYKIQVSNDKTTWTDKFSTTTENGGTDTINLTNTSGRYVRVYGTTRATVWGYSLFELEVYADSTNPTPTFTPTNTPTFTPNNTPTKTPTATATPLTYTFTLNKAGNGDGELWANGSKINYGTHTVVAGSIYNFTRPTATPNGNTFDRVEGDIEGYPQVVMDKNKTITVYWKNIMITPTQSPSVTPTYTPTVTPTAAYANWTAGKAYTKDEIVIYNGKKWKCTYSHTSNDAWYPGAPGLWFWEEVL